MDHQNRDSEFKYLKTLSIAELMTYLKMGLCSSKLGKVGEVLIAREKNARNDLEMHKDKCSKLSIALQEEKKQVIKYEQELELTKIIAETKFKEYKEKVDFLSEELDRTNKEKKDEAEAQKKKYKYLQTRVSVVVKEMSDFIYLESHESEKTSFELEGKKEENKQSEGENGECSSSLVIIKEEDGKLLSAASVDSISHFHVKVGGFQDGHRQRKKTAASGNITETSDNENKLESPGKENLARNVVKTIGPNQKAEETGGSHKAEYTRKRKWSPEITSCDNEDDDDNVPLNQRMAELAQKVRAGAPKLTNILKI